jgi:hypothetical protein
MTTPNHITEDSFERARAAFFGTATITSRPAKPLTTLPNAQKDASPATTHSKP